MKAVNIEWDVDWEEIEEYMDKEDLRSELPKEIELPEWIDLEDEDAMSDYISDFSGFCHKGFEIEK